MNQELGPLQRKWVEALRSGKYKQARGRLRQGDALCCMGVACEVAGEERQFDFMLGATYGGEEAKLPELTCKAMRFRSPVGQCLGRSINGRTILTAANDHGVSFQEIADFVEAHPEAVFTEPA